MQPSSSTNALPFSVFQNTSPFHCVKIVQIGSFFWSVFSRIRTEYGEIDRIQSKCGKIRTRKNSVLGHFSRSPLETNFKFKQLYFQSSIDYNEMRAATWSSYFSKACFIQKIFNCLVQLLLSNNCFLVANTVSDQLLEDKYFFSTATFQRSFFSRISNYSERVLFRSSYFFRTNTFSEEELF